MPDKPALLLLSVGHTWADMQFTYASLIWVSWFTTLLNTCLCYPHRQVQASQTLGVRAVSQRFQKPYNVCTSDWAPIVRCTDGQDPDEFSGYQVALWRELARDLGWADGDWSFVCMDWTPMIDDLLDPNGACTMAAAGVEVSMPNIVAGLKFSYPIYKSGFQVMVASAIDKGGTWAFAEAFHWSVWVILGTTSVIVSLLVTLTEILTPGNAANKKGLRGWTWYCIGKLVQVVTHVGDPKTWGSRVLVLCYAFLVLIMIHLFTATTATKMTMQRLQNDITGKGDLPGKKVETWEPYVPLLRKYSIDADGLPWETDDDAAVMLNNLHVHKHQALVLDTPVIQYMASQAEHCDLFPVGDPFETFSLAIAFPSDAPDTMIQQVSASIVRLQTMTNRLDELEAIYVQGGIAQAESSSDSTKGATSNSSTTAGNNTATAAAGTHVCSSSSFGSSTAGHSSSSQVQLKQVIGLWYILVATCGLALLITALQNIRYSRWLCGPQLQLAKGGLRHTQSNQRPQSGIPDLQTGNNHTIKSGNAEILMTTSRLSATSFAGSLDGTAVVPFDSSDGVKGIFESEDGSVVAALAVTGPAGGVQNGKASQRNSSAGGFKQQTREIAQLTSPAAVTAPGDVTHNSTGVDGDMVGFDNDMALVPTHAVQNIALQAVREEEPNDDSTVLTL